jgi:hypothetical protein
LARDDSGLYTCEALNSQGSAVINITVVVECKIFLLFFCAPAALVFGENITTAQAALMLIFMDIIEFKQSIGDFFEN